MGLKKDNAVAKITASDVLSLLRARFGADKRKYICASEVALTTGGGARRIDFCVMTCYASQDFAIEGIEIKVDPTDLRHEIQEHKKHEAFFSCFDYYSIAVTDQAYQSCKDLIPSQWGIYIVKETKESIKRRQEAEAGLQDDIPTPHLMLNCKRKPLPLETRQELLPRGFVASFARKSISDALAPHLREEHDEYRRGYEDGRQRGFKEGERSASEELTELRGYRDLANRLQDDDGYFSFLTLEQSLDLIAAMQITRVQSLYDALVRIHEETAHSLAALSGRFELSEWARGTANEQDVSDEELMDMIKERDRLIEDARRRWRMSVY